MLATERTGHAMIASRVSQSQAGRSHPLLCKVLLLCALALYACGGDDAGSDAGSHEDDGHAGAVAAGTSGASAAGAGTNAAGAGASDGGAAAGLVGNFLVKMVAPKDDADAYTSFLGKLYDAPQPPLVPLVLDSEEGDCRLMVPEIPFCDPECEDGACTADDECTPYPTAQSAGTVRVHGLGEETLELEPVGSSFTYMPAAALPYPPCTEGDSVHLEADAFELQSTCIAPIVLPDEQIRVRSGEGVAVTWTPGEASDGRIRLVLDIAHHGGQKGEIDCDVADTGAFEIPEALVTKLVGLGVAGYPTIVVSRMASSAASGLPDVTLTIAAEIERVVDTGVTSCGSSSDCPGGMTCDLNRLVCVP
jgi:hypothetical protein